MVLHLWLAKWRITSRFKGKNTKQAKKSFFTMSCLLLETSVKQLSPTKKGKKNFFVAIKKFYAFVSNVLNTFLKEALRWKKKWTEKAFGNCARSARNHTLTMLCHLFDTRQSAMGRFESRKVHNILQYLNFKKNNKMKKVIFLGLFSYAKS